MSDHRKRPTDPQSRHDGAPTLPSDSDSFNFSIESTTMRLKSLKLRRAEKDSQKAAEIEAAAKVDPAAPRSGPAGRVRHDERGVAVWDWAVATGEFATLSQTAALKKLSISELAIEDHRPGDLRLEVSGRDVGGGGDPYNQRGSGQRPAEAARRQGVTGSADRAEVLDQLLGKKT
jgi:hypothetical protein